MRDLVKSRDWGLSILFVDDNHEVPQMFANSLNKIPEFNILPVFGESLLLYLGVLAQILRSFGLSGTSPL